jgi:hypothetical protein
MYQLIILNSIIDYHLHTYSSHWADDHLVILYSILNDRPQRHAIAGHPQGNTFSESHTLSSSSFANTFSSLTLCAPLWDISGVDFQQLRGLAAAALLLRQHHHDQEAAVSPRHHPQQQRRLQHLRRGLHDEGRSTICILYLYTVFVYCICIL